MNLPRIAIWYHCRLLGGDPFIDPNHSAPIMQDQMAALRESGLLSASKCMFVGVNGDKSNDTLATSLAPTDANIIWHGPDARSELTTLCVLHNWATRINQTEPKDDWLVFYHHIKGATRVEPFWRTWRKCMEGACVWDWKRCVHDLMNGAESVGAHWIIPEVWGPSQMKGTTTPYWGGNFWWARASFLATLPTPQTNARAGVREDFYLAEKWIGTGPRRPRVIDYRKHWPNPTMCAEQRP
jgi:hypothetical protein